MTCAWTPPPGARTTAFSLVVLALFLAVAPAADAQGLPPLSGACGPSTISPVAGATQVAAGTNGFVTVRVTNEGAFPGRIDIDATIVGGAGWTVPNPSQTAEAVPAGENRTFSFTVQPAAEGADTFATLEFAGRLTCAGSGQTAVAFQAEKQSVTVELAGGSTGTFGGALGKLLGDPTSILILGGVLLLGVVGVFAMSKRKARGGLSVRAEEVQKKIRPGRGTSFPVALANDGSEDETIMFDVGEAPAGWTAFMAVPEIVLAAGEDRTVWLMVRSPPGAPDGDRAEITVTIRVAGGDGRPRAKDVTVVAEVSEREGESSQ